ncbi:ferric-dicitrate binding protein FerR (iron transport regulator) [Chitinophaga dinghuensis]|uniref:Ferric-dicitrate binding protein FerR (Iron transport regulator) n=1 Tax=Chitinophaga dinghuensis TaxID=1539050 RepID=A0A327W847_9BACT|nr:FecR domain-containing protein [Chitinophaga dinghuensis]RAJ82208.1 ferric-dicitrate binding protein FerR (iron transport regulator) [Chitinophaga dinghuensis]
MQQSITTAYLVTTDSFIHYCLRTNETDFLYWQAYVIQYPEHRSVIEQAKQMVLTMHLYGQQEEIREQKEKLRQLLHSNEDAVIVGIGKRRFYYHLRIAVAVICIVAVGLAAFFYKPKRTVITVSTARGEVKEVLLPDSSVVWMNAGSRMEYTTDFSYGRHVTLADGEAFFEVRHDSRRPFTVKTGSGLEVKDLGTTFNVSTYAGQEERVAVHSGLVAVSNSKYIADSITAGEMITGDRQSAALKRSTMQLSGADWRTGYIRLDNVSFSMLKEVIERTYDVTVVFDDPSLATCRITTAFQRKDDIRQTLKALQLIYGISSRQVGNTIHIAGNACK